MSFPLPLGSPLGKSPPVGVASRRLHGGPAGQKWGWGGYWQCTRQCTYYVYTVVHSQKNTKESITATELLILTKLFVELT